ncbi:hypothetical protein T484DRAFT_1862980 [Baffinella frigidus]|nr:hypothetical protein T484DRAFT_1862980 [Cryptophyta sp. CCMP2293]
MKDDAANLAILAPWARLRAAVKSPERAPAVQPAGYAGAFGRQSTRTMLSTMILASNSPKHAASTMVRVSSEASDATTTSRVCSVWSKDGDDDFDVEASLKVLREHASRVKQMTPAPQPDFFGSIQARSRSSEAGRGGQSMSMSALLSGSAPDAGPGKGSFGSTLHRSSLDSRLRQPLMSTLVSRAPPEAGIGTGTFGKGSFGSIVRRSIVIKCFSKDAEDRARERASVHLKAQKANAQKAIARSFQAQNFLHSPKARNSFPGAAGLLLPALPPKDRASSSLRLPCPAPGVALTRRRSSTMGDLYAPLRLHPQRDALPGRALVCASPKSSKSSALHPDAPLSASLASANKRSHVRDQCMEI